MDDFSIEAWKPYEGKERSGRVSTNVDDPDATLFKLRLPNVEHYMWPEFDVLHKAQSSLNLFRKVYEEGIDDGKAEVRRALGCNQ